MLTTWKSSKPLLWPSVVFWRPPFLPNASRSMGMFPKVTNMLSTKVTLQNLKKDACEGMLLIFFVFFSFLYITCFFATLLCHFFFHFEQSNYATFLILAKQCNNIKWMAQIGSKRVECLGLVFGVKGYEMNAFIILHYTICNKLWPRMQTSSREW